MIFHVDFTVTLGYEEELVTILALLDDRILRLFEQSYDVVNEEVNNILVSGKYLITINGTRKDM